MNRIHIDENSQPAVASRGSYEKPRVTTFGSVAKLTQGGSSTKVDGSHHTKV